MQKRNITGMTFLVILIYLSLSMSSTFVQSGLPERVINLDFNLIKGSLNTMFRECIGAGRANEGLRADWQQQLAYVKKECGGGPATAGAAWELELIDFCHNNILPLDFISTHSYGVRQGYLDEFGNSGTVLDKNPMNVSGDVLNSRKEIANSSMPNLELHYTEWSSSCTPADPIHDSYHQAVYVPEKIKQVGDAANSVSYWVFTDIFKESGPRFTPVHGGFGLLNCQAINKPAFYSCKFMNQLGNTELMNTDSCSWACKDEKGNIQVLLWDFTCILPDGSVNNQDYYIHDLPAALKVIIAISGIPAGEYKFEIYLVGYRATDPYTTYVDMDRPHQLTKAQVQKIKELNDGSAIAREKINVKNGTTFLKKLDIRENDVFLIKNDKAPNDHPLVRKF